MPTSYAKKSVDTVEEKVRDLEKKVNEEKVRKRETRKTSKDKLDELKKVLFDEVVKEASENV